MKTFSKLSDLLSALVDITTTHYFFVNDVTGIAFQIFPRRVRSKDQEIGWAWPKK